MTPSIIISCIFISGYKLRWMKQISISPGSHFIYEIILQMFLSDSCEFRNFTEKIAFNIFFLKCKYIPTTDGSKSMKMALGTCFPELVSAKKVLKESSACPMDSSVGICPSGIIPCSRQYNSQQAFPIWTPAWPRENYFKLGAVHKWRHPPRGRGICQKVTLLDKDI